jgi:hypothetical protein
MSLSMLDTHRAVKRLMEAGFSSDQAETVTDMLREARVSDLADAATKADLQAAEGVLKADLQAVEATLNADIQGLKSDLRDLRADLRTVETTVKADIRAVEATLKGEISALRGEMNAKIAEGGRTTLQWAVGLFVAQTAIIVGLIKLIH